MTEDTGSYYVYSCKLENGQRRDRFCPYFQELVLPREFLGLGWPLSIISSRIGLANWSQLFSATSFLEAVSAVLKSISVSRKRLLSGLPPAPGRVTVRDALALPRLVAEALGFRRLLAKTLFYERVKKTTCPELGTAADEEGVRILEERVSLNVKQAINRAPRLTDRRCQSQSSQTQDSATADAKTM